MLTENEISDNITKMVRFSVARAIKVDVSELEGLDMPGRCGSAPAVLSKRILLFLAIQKELNVELPVEKTPDIQTLKDLADVLIPLLHH